MDAFLGIVVKMLAVVGYVFACIMVISYGTGTDKETVPWITTAVRAVGVGMLILGFWWLRR